MSITVFKGGKIHVSIMILHRDCKKVMIGLWISFRLHATKKISPSPILLIGSIFYKDVDQGSLIFKKIEK